MPAELDQARHARERGDILRTLKEDYGRTTMVRTLIRALDAQGISLSQRDIEFHLQYLCDQGYIAITRYRDGAKFRADRPMPAGMKPDSVEFCRLMPRGLQLLDGQIPEDPSVAF